MNFFTSFVGLFRSAPTVRKSLAGGAAGAIAIAVTLITPFEGLRTKAYHDNLARGIPTVCYGETEGVRMGDEYTPAECSDMLAKKLPRYNAEISKCIKVPISDKTRAAFISFSYNVGTAGFCRSSAARKLNAGDAAGACDALLLWNTADGKVIAGLTRRREAEHKLCREGI